MLTDPKAVEIISKARQKNVARPVRSDRDINNIFADFFAPQNFSASTILELGPGQFDFARRARDMGGTVDVVDSDPAVLDLGRYLGFCTINADLKLWPADDHGAQYDAIFCKFSINAFWLKSPEEVTAQVQRLNALLKPLGWGWIAPWNGGKIIEEHPEVLPPLLNAQSAAFRSLGWTVLNLTPELASRYGITGSVANHVLFVRNLAVPAGVAAQIMPV